ncbi:hypothetical protein BGZ51_004909 [Haplosporangium sp. Z 767]|nr:hypothetical protein BGZ51_004909 [Haplosporangium sp. Z 767]KAF9196366.1 hypothetical protein BGZ50_000768 [Haplosporangium sp. Z 11]
MDRNSGTSMYASQGIHQGADPSRTSTTTSSSSPLGNKAERGTLDSTHSGQQTSHEKQFYSSKYHPNNRLSDEKIEQASNDPWQTQSLQQRSSNTAGNNSGESKDLQGADKRFVDYKEGDQEEEDDEDDEDVDENLGNMYDNAQYN